MKFCKGSLNSVSGLLRTLALGAGLGLTALAGCSGESGGSAASSSGVSTASSDEVFRWKLITTWPKNLPGLGVAPENLAKRISEMSNGRLNIKVLSLIHI